MRESASYGGSDRASFISRVTTALACGPMTAPATPPPAVDDRTVRVTGPGEDLPALFSERATKAGMNVHRVDSAQAAALVVRLLQSAGARRVSLPRSLPIPDLSSRLTQSSIEFVPHDSVTGLDPLYDVHAGITDVQAAIAETGTLVCWSGPGRGRGLSLVPPLHIALVRQSDLLPDLIDYLRTRVPADPARGPSSVAFITGPSKTADIEGVLITGVHGPREVHIVLIDDA